MHSDRITELFLLNEQNEQIANKILDNFFSILKNDETNFLNLAFHECYTAVVNKRLSDKNFDFTKAFSSNVNFKGMMLRLKFIKNFNNRTEFINTSSNYLLSQYGMNNTLFYPAPSYISLKISPSKQEKNLCLDILDSAEISRNYANEIFRLFSYIKVCQNHYGKIKFNNQETLLTGTGSKIYTRTVSDIALNKGSKVYRFSHGGERGFFNERAFEFTEYSLCTKYFTHGYHEQKGLTQFKNLGLSNFENLHSKFHLNFRQEPNLKKHNFNKIIYISNSFTHPINKFPNIRPMDTIYKEFQSYYLMCLKKINLPISIKLHPKCLNSANEIKHFTGYQFVSGKMSDLIGKGYLFAFDTMGSAMVEVLSAGECVIFWNQGIRKTNKYFESLKKNVFIVEGQKLNFDYRLIKDFFDNNQVERTKFASKFYE